MKLKKIIHAVDSHTCGEPTRVIVGGLPRLKYKGRYFARKVFIMFAMIPVSFTPLSVKNRLMDLTISLL